MEEKTLSFEEAMARIEVISRELENGIATLDQSIGLFEEATKLIMNCRKMLDEAQQKVVRLSKGESGEPVETPFDQE